MIRISFTEEKLKALDDEPSHHHHPRVQKKMEALWLKSRGLSHGEIAPLTSISLNTLPAYLSQYLEGGIEALKIVNFGQHPATTIKQAAAKIKELIGIKRCQNRIRLFLKLISLKRYKVGTQLRPVKKRITATFGGSHNWWQSPLFCRYRSFRTGTISRFSRVVDSNFHPSSGRPKAIQCFRGLKCHY